MKGQDLGTLLSFENPVYGNVSDGYGDNSRDNQGSDEDLRIYGDRKCPHCFGGKVTGKCILIVSTTVVVLLVAITIALGVYYGTKDHLPPVSSESQTGRDKPSTGPTVSLADAQVSKQYSMTLRIVEGPYSIYYTAYTDHSSSQFGKLSTQLKSILNALYEGSRMKEIYIDSTLVSVRRGSLIAVMHLEFKEYVLNLPTKTPTLNFSSVDIKDIFINAAESSKNVLRLTELTVDKQNLMIKPVNPIPYNMIGKTTTTMPLTKPTKATKKPSKKTTTTTTTIASTTQLPATKLSTTSKTATIKPSMLHTGSTRTPSPRTTVPTTTTTTPKTTSTTARPWPLTTRVWTRTTTVTTTTLPRTTARLTARTTPRVTTRSTARTTLRTTPRTTLKTTPRTTTRATTRTVTTPRIILGNTTSFRSTVGTPGAWLNVSTTNRPLVTRRYTGPTYIPQSSPNPPMVNNSSPCLPAYYHCPEGVITLPEHREYCIGIREKCDGMVDCRNGQDEEGCGSLCTGGGFRCQTPGAIDRIYTGFCTLRGAHCDGFADCTDRSDEWNCTCNSGDFKCANGYDLRNGDECVNEDFWCDRENDCSDGSDEMNCTYSCPDGFFMCANDTVNRPVNTGAAYLRFCIQANEVCDGHTDCRDGSDEPDCYNTCPRGKYRCAGENATVTGRSTSCYLEADLCDRQVDCSDGSDEWNCTFQCPDPNHMFQCKTGVIRRYPYVGFCLYPYERCNGVEECVDGSDEEDCPGKTCTEFQFKCTMGTETWEDDHCIPLEHRCDRVDDCSNSSARSEDEVGCDYICLSKGTFSCRTDTLVPMIADEPGRGFCLAGEARCDGVQHCRDNSDEEECNATCEADQFKCTSGISIHDQTGLQCVPRRYMCDREADCTDASDEPDNCQFNCSDGMIACKDGILLRWPHTGFCIYHREWCDGYQDCVDNSDEKNCQDTTCAPDQFQCINRLDIYYGNGCLEKHVRCDRMVHCLDGSDEEGCTYPCPEGQFQCGTGQNTSTGEPAGECLHIARRCDGLVDCLDGSDERSCNEDCPADQFRCQNGTGNVTGEVCIDALFHCDRVVDCTDGSDESANCTYQCPEGQFKCLDGTKRDPLVDPADDRGYCVPEAFHCNGIRDCKDGSDEVNCTACEAYQFMCENGSAVRGHGRCIPKRFQCDKDNDCTDESDEKDCDYQCPEGEVACKSGTLLRWPFYGYCIPLNDICDGYEDCNDRSDEANCTGIENCNEAQFTCENGTDVADGNKCIHMGYRCDRFSDCSDLSDEADCNYTCPEGKFMCKSGTADVQPARGYCLAERFRCDGTAQCLDRSDEDGCEVSCREGKIPCTTGVSAIHGSPCIRTEWICDREADCVDASDESNCTYSCPDGERACETGILSRWPFFGFCYPAFDRCDGFKDCEDGSDEADCNEPDIAIEPCLGRQFQCANVSAGEELCVPDVMRCDRALDCADGSDEVGCNYTCPNSSFTCEAGAISAWPQRGYCIPTYHVCDGLSHCEDVSDEANCNGTCFVSGFFRCRNGVNNYTGSACVPPSDRCDGKADCPDASDEDDCPQFNVTCGAYQTSCHSGRVWYLEHVENMDEQAGCINTTEVCDGFVDCSDHSDEIGCSRNCSADEFRCGHPENILGSVCISGNKYCDGRSDCKNAIDERCNPLQPPAPQGQFYCVRTLSLVPFSARCNGVSDCDDDSDEQNC